MSISYSKLFVGISLPALCTGLASLLFCSSANAQDDFGIQSTTPLRPTIQKELRLYDQSSTSSVAGNIGIRAGAGTLSYTLTLPTLRPTANQVLAANAVSGGNVTLTWATPFSGTGTTNFLAKFASAGTLTNSLLFDNGTNIVVGTATPSSTTRFEIRGTGTTSTTTALEVDNINGSPLLVVRDDARVGIGTTSPKSALEILQGTSAFIRMVRSGSNADYGFEAGNNGMGLYDYTNSDYRWWVSPTGDVGIGTTSPNAKFAVATEDINTLLDVVGGASSGDAIVRFGGNLDGSNYVSGDMKWGIGVRRPSNIFTISYNSTGIGESLEANQVLSINTLGNVGIGTTSPALKLHIYGTTGYPATSGTSQTGLARFDSPSNSNVLDIGQGSTSPFGLWLQGTSRIDLSTTYPILLNPNGGNVGIGTLTPIAKLHVVSSSSSEPNELSLERYSTPNASSHIVQRSARGTATSPSTLQSGDVVAKSSAWSSTGMVSGFTEVGKFEWVATENHTNSGNLYGSRLDIYTRQSGATSVSRRMTISDGGAVTMSSLTGIGSRYVTVDASGTLTATISVASDIRLKSNIEVIPNALQKVMGLRGVTYNWKDGRDTTRVLGMIAQEMLKVAPELVFQNADGYYAIHYGETTGLLVEAIKEQQKIIEQLKAEQAATGVLIRQLQLDLQAIRKLNTAPKD